jgi:hypothetical protein
MPASNSPVNQPVLANDFIAAGQLDHQNGYEAAHRKWMQFKLWSAAQGHNLWLL